MPPSPRSRPAPPDAKAPWANCGSGRSRRPCEPRPKLLRSVATRPTALAVCALACRKAFYWSLEASPGLLGHRFAPSRSILLPIGVLPAKVLPATTHAARASRWNSASARPGNKFTARPPAAADERPRTAAERMLELLRHLETVDGPALWAMTSHDSLCLLAGDDYALPILVAVRCDGIPFYIEYRMAQDKAPWPDAYVTGITADVHQAVEMITFGLSEAMGAAKPVGGDA